MTETQPIVHPIEHEGPAENSPWRTGFWSLIVTQFQGAMSDNIVRWMMQVIIISQLSDPAQHAWFASVVGFLFSAPFILFSMFGGWLADRYSKRSVTIGTKVFEVFVSSFTLVALLSGNQNMLLSCVFLISTQAAFFGPSKYGLLPELVPEPRLSWANGVIELGTFIAIIAGTAFGPWLAVRFKDDLLYAGITLIAITLFGLVTSFGITHVPAHGPHKKLE